MSCYIDIFDLNCFGKFLQEGTPGEGIGIPGGVRSRMVRSSKYPAGTLWLRTVAAPSSLPAGS
ncbi:MAG: hypothetical protein HFH33_04530 [Eubacterium sp.]|nr:hypothetical protein [Eubacterium sp.]